jgi:hypothetical protein
MLRSLSTKLIEILAISWKKIVLGQQGNGNGSNSVLFVCNRSLAEKEMEIELQLGGMCLEDVQKRLLDERKGGGKKENRGQKEIDGDDGAQTASDVP